ncbi:MAG: DMT family transporter [Pseudomonadota bacterium]|nr:DMT family transporter [Pseudomonadota bacterium]
MSQPLICKSADAVHPAPDPRKAYLYAAATILFWSTVASAFKLTLGYITPDELVFHASLFATVVLGLLVLAGGRRGELASWRGKDYALSVLLGLLNPCIYYLLLFTAYDRLPAQEAMPLNFVWPAVLVLLAVVLLGQRIHALSFLALGISFLGVVVIATRGEPLALGFSDPAGVAAALGSAIVWGLYWIYSSRDRRDSVQRLFFNFLFGTLFIAAWLTITSGWSVPEPRALAGAFYIALFEMALAFACWLQALKLARNTAQVGTLIYLTPFFSLLVIHFVVGEEILSSTFIGLLLIVAGIIFQRRIERSSGTKT